MIFRKEMFILKTLLIIKKIKNKKKIKKKILKKFQHGKRKNIFLKEER